MEIVPKVKVCVICGVVEDRTTIYSDIDILIVLPEKVEKKNLYVKILTKAMDKYGLPLDAPVELHITTRKKQDTMLNQK
ncbi:MAG: nucleotidyltransferase domain-containing protein [Candidatus Jordarchaeales archaeon]